MNFPATNTPRARERAARQTPIHALSECKHCGLLVARTGDSFCCAGCASVFSLLEGEGLGRYYDLGGGRGAPALLAGTTGDRKWLEALEVRRGERVTLDVQGVHCAACVWLFEKLFSRQPGALSLLVNPALGKLDLTVTSEFSLHAFVASVERFGYRLGPSLKADRAPHDGLLLRMGICIAIAMNAMIFAIAMYAGLDAGPLFRLFRALEFGLGALAVAVGGSVFFRSAIAGWRARVLHLDAPIALGIALAFGSSTYAYLTGDAKATYFDTLTVFVALMLVGRWMQERLVERNRRQLLASDGADGILTRRIEGERVALIRGADVRAGDRLLVAPGDLVPVEGELEEDRGTCSLDWISGESVPSDLSRGATVPAGAFNAGASAFTVRARTDFASSPILDLLRTPHPGRRDASRATPWWRGFAKIYVVAVLAVAVVGFGGWLLMTGDVQRSLEVTAGVLIVTCPCAFGIATPMAYELVYAGLRRAGLFVRSSGFLDRAAEVERVVFDKTGTLTTGTLALASPGSLDALDDEEVHALYNLVVRSAHPKSVAVARALSSRGRFEPGMRVHEEAGTGLSLAWHGRVYRLVADGEEIAFLDNDQVRLRIALCEEPRADARAEVQALGALGYEVWILSGDTQARVDALARSLGVALARALGEKRPADKEAFFETHPRALMVGDGINDAPAVERALCSGTPAIDRPFLPARTDFYFTTAGLRPVTLALRASKALARVTRRNLAVAVVYNVVSVGLAWAGLLSPLVCAVIMPLSSLTVVGATVASLSQRSALWRS